ncbi:putative transposase, partial [Phenoliferia sp. Uapishka_3]
MAPSPPNLPTTPGVVTLTDEERQPVRDEAEVSTWTQRLSRRTWRSPPARLAFLQLYKSYCWRNYISPPLHGSSDPLINDQAVRQTPEASSLHTSDNSQTSTAHAADSPTLLSMVASNPHTMPDEYTFARKPFGPVLTGEDNYEEFQRNAADFLSTKSLWGVASGDDTLDACINRAEIKAWKEKNAEAIGYYRGNCSERIKNKFVGLTTCAGMVAMTESLFKPRSREQAHQILASILRSQFIDGDDFEKFVLDLESKNDRLAAMGMECSDEQLLLALKASLPSSYDTTLQGFNTRSDGTYEDLRRLIMNDYKTKVAASADARAYYARQSEGPQVDARAYMLQAPAHILRATANIYLFTREDGKLCTNDGKVVDCRKCGANHTAVDCTQAAPIDVQSQSRNAPAWTGTVTNAAAAANASNQHGPNHARNVQKRTARKIQRAAAQGDIAQPFIGMMRSVGASRVYAARSVDTSDWMLDTGATINGTPVLADLTASSVKVQYTGIEGIKSGELLAGTHVGTVDFKSKDGHSFQLGDVVHTTEMSDKIISLQRLADRGAIITLIKDGGTVLLPNKISLAITRKNGFWTLSNVSATAALASLATPLATPLPSTTPTPKTRSSSTIPPYRIVVTRAQEKRRANFGRWHKRLCHPGLSTFKRTVQGGLLDGLELGGEIPEEHRCVGCAACKATRLPHKGDASIHRATRPLQSIKIDLSGRTDATVHNEEYYMLIRDGYSHFPWVFLLKQKSDAFPVFVKWQNAIENKIPFKVAEIHSDRGTEFINGRWEIHNSQRGITSYLANPYTAQENGVAERGNRTEKGRAGAALKESGLPPQYWGYCIQHAVLCDGVLYSVANPKGKSSYEVLFGKRPNVKDFRAPGTPGWVYVPEAERRGHIKYDKAKSGRCLGMNPFGPGWIMLMDGDQRIRTTSNVVFWENDLDDMPAFENINRPAPTTATVVPTIPIPRFPLDINPFAVLHNGDSDDYDPEEDGLALENLPQAHPLAPIPVAVAAPPAAAQPPPPPAPPVVAPLRRSTRTRVPTLHTPSAPRPAYHGLTGDEIDTLEAIDEDEDGLVAAYLNVDPQPAPAPAALQARVRIAKAIKTAKDTGAILPKTWTEAMQCRQSGKWKGGEAKEFVTLRGKDVFDIVDRKVGQVKPIPCHFVYALKKGEDGEWMFDEDGDLDGQKVRLVAGGNFQDKALLVEGSYSATASGESVRFILGESARPGFSLYTADVKGAYLEADLPYDVYLYIPKSNDPELEEARLAGKILLLKKCLYGLVESGMFWSRLLKDLLVGLGYKCLDADKGIYALHQDGKVCYVPTHVDDLLGATDCPDLWKQTIAGLAKRVSFSKNGPVGQHLGALIEKATDGSVYVSMESYITDMNVEFGMENCSPCSTPMLAGTYVTTEGPPLSSISQEQFVTLVAKLNWIFQVSHPEIAVPVKSLGRHLHNPTEPMFLVAKRVMRYLQGAKSFGLVFRHDGLGLVVFCDADWAGCIDTRQSRSGWLIWRNGPVSWGSLLQGPLALSSSESEFYAACTVVKRTLPLAYLGHELGLIDPNDAIPLFIDNTSAIHMISSPNVNQRTRHIAIRYHYIKKAIKDKVFAPSYIASKLNPADLFTKALGPEDFLCQPVRDEAEVSTWTQRLSRRTWRSPPARLAFLQLYKSYCWRNYISPPLHLVMIGIIDKELLVKLRADMTLTSNEIQKLKTSPTQFNHGIKRDRRFKAPESARALLTANPKVLPLCEFMPDEEWIKISQLWGVGEPMELLYGPKLGGDYETISALKPDEKTINPNFNKFARG